MRKFNRGVALFNCLQAGASWAAFAPFAFRDWTVVFVPLFMTFVVAVELAGYRRLYLR